MALLTELRRLVLPVTMEPVLFLFVIGSSMQYTAMQSLVYAKVSLCSCCLICGLYPIDPPSCRAC